MPVLGLSSTRNFWRRWWMWFGISWGVFHQLTLGRRLLHGCTAHMLLVENRSMNVIVRESRLCAEQLLAL